MIDLHIHTNESDGELAPAELVDLAIKSGLQCIAITDHDTIDGCRKAIDYAKNKKIKIIPGIEISCYEEEKGFGEVHVVGLFVDYENPLLAAFCENIKTERINQKKLMIKKLQELGFDITFEEVCKIAHHSFGRPHLAKILVQKYPQQFPNVKSVFDQYLGHGKPAYVGRINQTKMKDTVDLIKKARGIAILAHPGVYSANDALVLLKYFLECGGQGLETYYPYDLVNGITVKEAQSKNSFFKKYAEEHGLLQSGGSDFHGPGVRKTVKLGQLVIPFDLVTNLSLVANLRPNKS